jgi:hypothetical protein
MFAALMSLWIICLFYKYNNPWKISLIIGNIYFSERLGNLQDCINLGMWLFYLTGIDLLILDYKLPCSQN